MTKKAAKRLVIAVDGPAASGKGTLARKLAAHFDLPYLDTGKLYRAVGYEMLRDGENPGDANMAVEYATSITPDELENSHLYDEGVGQAASIVSAIPAVRDALFDYQQNFANQEHGAVLDGRDIGTVICPNADMKFFITADLATRATRRFKELQNRGVSVIYNDVLDDLKRRDERDSGREIAPLKPADDAIRIDTTGMDADEVLEAVLASFPSENNILAG